MLGELDKHAYIHARQDNHHLLHMLAAYLGEAAFLLLFAMVVDERMKRPGLWLKCHQVQLLTVLATAMLDRQLSTTAPMFAKRCALLDIRCV